jgi:hypothetical protein
MKAFIKSGLSFLFLIAFILFGCEKDKSAKELIVGKWEVKTMKMIAYENNVKTDEYTETYTSKEMEIEIKSDGTGTEYEDEVANDTFTWTMSGNSITVSISGEDDMVMTASVTESTLVLTSTETEIDGETTYKYESIITAKRE